MKWVFYIILVFLNFNYISIYVVVNKIWDIFFDEIIDFKVVVGVWDKEFYLFEWN